MEEIAEKIISEHLNEDQAILLYHRSNPQIVTANLAFTDKFQSDYDIIVSRISLDSNMVNPQVKNVDISTDLSTW